MVDVDPIDLINLCHLASSGLDVQLTKVRKQINSFLKKELSLDPDVISGVFSIIKMGHSALEKHCQDKFTESTIKYNKLIVERTEAQLENMMEKAKSIEYFTE